jgi:DNA-binding NarL/FixJ family response regulator
MLAQAPARSRNHQVATWLDVCKERGLINELQVEVLRLLASGLTDDTVGKKLDISSRTVQRHVSRVMVLLGARSRLELGILLAARVPTH